MIQSCSGENRESAGVMTTVANCSDNFISRELIDGRHEQPSRLNSNSLVRVRGSGLTCPCQSQPTPSRRPCFFCHRGAVQTWRWVLGYYSDTFRHTDTHKHAGTHTHISRPGTFGGVRVVSQTAGQRHSDTMNEQQKEVHRVQLGFLVSDPSSGQNSRGLHTS